MGIHNLGISRQLSLAIVTIGVVVAIVTVSVAFIVSDVSSEKIAPIATLMVSLSALLVSTVGSLKATEAADTSAKAKNVVEFSVSQQSAHQMAMTQHFAEICPRDDCPLRAIHYEDK